MSAPMRSCQAVRLPLMMPISHATVRAYHDPRYPGIHRARRPAQCLRLGGKLRTAKHLLRCDMRETIWAALTRKLGREPTHAEAKAEVKRILEQALIERAERGRLAHQRRR